MTVKKKIATAALILVSGTLSVMAQEDCSKIHYTVTAGGDIDVCRGGSVKLDGVIGDDATRGVWRGGKGKFDPGREALDAEYTPSDDELEGAGIVLILVGDNPKYTCEKGRSQMHIMVRADIKADAGPDQHVCAGSKVHLNGITTGGKPKSVTWTTNGTGTIENPHSAKAVYTPSDADISKGAVSLQFGTEAFGHCVSDSDAMILMFVKTPDFTLIPEKYIKAGETADVAVRSSEQLEGVFSWTTNGTGKFSDAARSQTVYTPSAEDVKKGTATLKVSLKYGAGCEMKKQLVLHIKK